MVKGIWLKYTQKANKNGKLYIPDFHTCVHFSKNFIGLVHMWEPLCSGGIFPCQAPFQLLSIFESSNHFTRPLGAYLVEKHLLSRNVLPTQLLCSFMIMWFSILNSHFWKGKNVDKTCQDVHVFFFPIFFLLQSWFGSSVYIIHTPSRKNLQKVKPHLSVDKSRYCCWLTSFSLLLLVFLGFFLTDHQNVLSAMEWNEGLIRNPSFPFFLPGVYCFW